MDAFIAFYAGAITIPGLIGLFNMVHWLKPAEGIDRSNVINRIRLWWFALTRPGLFVEIFPWLTQDELDNIS